MHVPSSRDDCHTLGLLPILEAAECHLARENLRRRMGDQCYWTHYFLCTVSPALLASSLQIDMLQRLSLLYSYYRLPWTYAGTLNIPNSLLKLSTQSYEKKHLGNTLRNSGPTATERGVALVRQDSR